MLEIGNLAVLCAKRKNVLFMALDNKVTIYVGQGTDKKAMSAKWNDNDQISRIIHELNFGQFKE